MLFVLFYKLRITLDFNSLTIRLSLRLCLLAPASGSHQPEILISWSETCRFWGSSSSKEGQEDLISCPTSGWSTPELLFLGSWDSCVDVYLALAVLRGLHDTPLNSYGKSDQVISLRCTIGSRVPWLTAFKLNVKLILIQQQKLTSTESKNICIRVFLSHSFPSTSQIRERNLVFLIPSYNPRLGRFWASLASTPAKALC